MSSRNIKAKALQIKTETQARANNANRVGGLFEDIADELTDLAEFTTNSVAEEATRAAGKEQELEATLYGASTSVIGKGSKNATEGSSLNLFKGEVTVTEGTLIISLSTQCVAYYRYKLNNEGSYTNVSASESASIQVNSPITYLEVSVSPSNVTATGSIDYSIINRVGSGTGIVGAVNSLSSAVTPIPQLVTDVQSISGTVQTIAPVVTGSPASSITQPFAFTVGGYIKRSGALHVSGQTSTTSNNLSLIRNAGYTSITVHVNAKEASATQKGVIAFFVEDSEDIVSDKTVPISVVLSTLAQEGFSDFTAEVPNGTKTIAVYTAVKENVALSTVTLSSPAVPPIANRVRELEQREFPSINLASYNGYSLPRNPQTLRILSVGNSYVQVPMQRLTAWLSALGIMNVVYAYTYHSGASLSQYYNSVNAGTASADFYVSTNGGAFTRIDASTGQETSTSYVSKLTDAFSYASWDIITFQQASSNAHQLDTITPYLPSLIEAARTYCQNAGVKIAWHSTHAHAVGYTDTSTVEQQNAVYSGIVEVAKYLESNYGLDLIIPSSTYVQNLRAVPNSYLISLGNSAYEGGASYKMLTKGNDTYTGGSDWCDFTSDGSHLNRYASIGACALFIQLLINSCFGKSIRRVDIKDWHYHQDSTMLHLQSIVRQCAIKAINNRYAVSTIDTSSDIY